MGCASDLQTVNLPVVEQIVDYVRGTITAPKLHVRFSLDKAVVSCVFLAFELSILGDLSLLHVLGCPADFGRPWTPEEITAAMNNGQSKSAPSTEAIKCTQEEADKKCAWNLQKWFVGMTQKTA